MIGKDFRKDILFPILCFISGWDVNKYYNSLNKSQWFSKDEVLANQFKEIKTMIKYASEEIPYYIDYFNENQLSINDFNVIEDISIFPTITKDIIRQNKKLFLPKTNNIKYTSQSTSGSTGKPFEYFMDKDRLALNSAAYFRFLEVSGYQFGQKIVTLGGVANLKTGLKQAVKNNIIKFVYNTNPLPSIRLNDTIYKSHIKTINKLKPTLIRGYPSVLECFAKFMLANDIFCHTPLAIYTVAEKVYDHQKELIEKAFKCKIFEGYGGGDGGIFTLICEYRKRHICLDTGLMEILNENQKPCVSGEMGEIVTTYKNYSLAMIRYRTSDYAIIDNKTCDCGRNWPIIKEIIGRQCDILHFDNGNTVTTPGVTVLFKDFSFDSYQIVQEAKDSLKISIVKGEVFVPSDVNTAVADLKKQCGEGVKVHYEFVNEIPRTKAGKRHFIRVDISN